MVQKLLSLAVQILLMIITISICFADEDEE